MTALFSLSVDMLNFFNMFNAKPTINPLDGGGVTYNISLSASFIGIDSVIWTLLKNKNNMRLRNELNFLTSCYI